jgi:hypothetical protein
MEHDRLRTVHFCRQPWLETSCAPRARAKSLETLICMATVRRARLDFRFPPRFLQLIAIIILCT